MRILLVTSSYSNSGDGSAAAGLFVHDFAKALTDRGADVEIVAPALAQRTGRDGKLGTRLFAVPRLPLSLLNPVSPLDWVSIMRTLAAGRRAVSNSCEENRPDYIFALWALPCGDWARVAARRFSIPYGTWALGSDIWGLGKLPLVRAYLAGVLSDAAHRFADGFALAADVRNISGRDCGFLPSSRAFGPPARRPLGQVPPYRLAFLGRWHPNKGPDLLLDALSRLTEPEWAMIEAVRFCGGGPLETELRTRIQALIANGRPVELGGFLDHAAAYSLFEWADYVVIPSRIESIPVVFSDAMQAHRPVIAAPVGDIPELIQTYACGVLATEASAAGIADAIRRALMTPPGQFMRGLGAAADAFSVRGAADEFLNKIRVQAIP